MSLDIRRGTSIARWWRGGGEGGWHRSFADREGCLIEGVENLKHTCVCLSLSLSPPPPPISLSLSLYFSLSLFLSPHPLSPSLSPLHLPPSLSLFLSLSLSLLLSLSLYLSFSVCLSLSFSFISLHLIRRQGHPSPEALKITSRQKLGNLQRKVVITLDGQNLRENGEELQTFSLYTVFLDSRQSWQYTFLSMERKLVIS